MLERLRTLRKSEKGFTLTELLITIVILGVLAGIVVFAVAAFTDEGEVVACETDRKNVEVAVEAYRAKVGTYPAGGTNTTRIDTLVTGKYLREAPSTPITLADATGVVGPAVCPVNP